MNALFTQDDNIGSLTTALGKDILLLLTFDGTDHVNGLFDYKVKALIRQDLDYDAILGTHATVELTTVNHGPTQFDGIITEIDWLRITEAGEEYELTLRPWFYLAGKRRQQRIFHDMSVDDILQEVLGAYSGYGPSTTKLELTGTYPKLEYTVQYRESDLTFACRLMERFGISYHFTHGAGNHCLVLTDTMEAMGTLPGLTREYRPVEKHYRKEEEHFWQWRKTRGMTTGKVKLTDYNFKTPTANLLQDQVGDAGYEHGEIESYDYPGVYPDAGEGADVSNLRIVQERSSDHRHMVQGDVMGLKAGMRCTAHGEFAEWLKGEPHLCLEARHSFASETYRSGMDKGAGEAEAYKGAYIMTPVSAPFAPLRKAAQPIIHGPQTARVVGEGEIDCDQYGRILVRFHWDLANAYSMRCRVSQNWASKGWGGMIIPRIGMEVIVEHLEGDPDKPIVTGCVFNGKNDPPYELPANKTKSVFRTDTHNSEEKYGFNELSFEDEKGREEVFLRASRDMTVKVDQHATARIDTNDVRSVGGHSLSEVELSRTDTIGKSFSISVGGGSGGALINGEERRDPFGLRPAAHRMSLGAAGAQGSYSVNAEKNMVFNAGSSHSLDVEAHAHERVGGTKSLNVAKTFRVSIGENAKEVVTGRKVVDVHEEIVLRCGKSEMRMTPDGLIQFNCVDMKVDSTSTIKMKSGRIDLN